MLSVFLLPWTILSASHMSFPHQVWLVDIGADFNMVHPISANQLRFHHWLIFHQLSRSCLISLQCSKSCYFWPLCSPDNTLFYASSPCPAVLHSFLQTHREDFQHLCQLIHLIPWSAFIDSDDINHSADIFLDLFDAAIKDLIPRVTQRWAWFSPWITIYSS